MAQQLDDRKRRVVPRWRPFREAAQLDLLDPARPTGRDRPTPAAGELEGLQEEWRRHRSPVYAAGLVDAALVSGQPEAAAEAAEFLLRTRASPITQGMAQTILSRQEAGRAPDDPLFISREERYRRIAALRRQLRRSPRDPVRWVDLALEYATLGQNASAEAALKRALALAPESRFVVRAAVRFFLHSGQREKAHHLFRGTGRTRQDPWLLAAEIVTAGFLNKTSRWIKHAERMVESGSYKPRHISELAGALGTVEYEHGARRKTRRFFERALIDPTENAVAQAGWIARHMRSFDMDRTQPELPRAFEAGAWDRFLRHEYEDSIRMSRMWLADEPFATRSAMFGSWVASTALGDLDAAIGLAEAARNANPDDPRPLAQLAFCYASQNRVHLAEDALRRLAAALPHNSGGRDREEWEVVQEANRGLIAYRRGQIEEGRLKYTSAIRSAATHKRKELAAGALLYFAREEARVSPNSASVHIAEARSALVAWEPFVRHAYERVLDRAASGG